MKEYFLIAAEGSYFSFFYNLALFVAMMVLLWEGHRRRFPMLKWVLLIIFTRIFFIIGTKLASYPLEAWMGFINTLRFLPATEKWLPGGLLLGAAALLTGKHLLGLKRNLLDSFALVLPVAIAIQRMGCFFAGCCHGTVSHLPWAVRYPSHFPAHYHQFSEGAILAHDSFSLPVHPVQLYEVAAMVAVAIGVIMLRKRFRSEGSLIWSSLLMVLLVRFFTEFVRDPQAHAAGGQMIWIMNITQWVILIACPLLLYIIWRKEAKGEQPCYPIPGHDLPLRHALSGLLLMSLLVIMLRNWFTYTEMLSLTTSFMIGAGILTAHLLKALVHSPLRWLYIAGSFLPLIIMSQVVPGNEQDSLLVNTYKSVSLGGATGKLTNYHRAYRDEGCGSVASYEYFDHDYQLVGLGYSSTTLYSAPYRKITLGVNAYFGDHTQIIQSTGKQESRRLFGMNPYALNDREWWGIGAGLHLGTLSYITENHTEETMVDPLSGRKTMRFYPQIYLRLGPEKLFFADYRFASHFPSALPGYRQQLGIGTGFGVAEGPLLRFGTTFMHYYLSGSVPIRNRLVLLPFIAWGTEPEFSGERQWQWSMGLSYRFDHKP